MGYGVALVTPLSVGCEEYGRFAAKTDRRSTSIGSADATLGRLKRRGKNWRACRTAKARARLITRIALSQVCNGPSEQHQTHREKCHTHHQDRQELFPDDAEIRTSINDRLREAHIVP